MLTQFPLAPSMRGAVLALGNFDGFHVGHQAVVSHASTLARREGRLLLVATFDPHPVRYFNPAAEPFLLSSLVQRHRLFREFGADDTVAIPFDAAIAALPADAFVEQWLGDKLGISCVVTGADFCFGKRRSGDVSVLGQAGSRFGIEASPVELMISDGEIASSTRIRALLLAGDVEGASALLGRPFRVQGPLEHRWEAGRLVPALVLHDQICPRPGAYRVQVEFGGEPPVEGFARVRSEERRVGKKGGSAGRSRWWRK